LIAEKGIFLCSGDMKIIYARGSLPIRAAEL
jgi:hypothetical protein